MINKYIEHTLLKPNATLEQIEQLACEALKHKFFGVCVNPQYAKKIKPLLDKTKLVVVVNFPLASNTIETTMFQTQQMLDYGADEIDTVLNISALKNKNYKKAEDDIKKTKQLCEKRNLKVILETDLLNKDEIITACKIAVSAGADFVKTSTGFVKGGVGATVENVKLMYDTVSPQGLKVKASGGIKTYNQAIDLINAGASRLGTSSGVEIIEGENND